jgi:hypothetical protein
MPAVVPFIPLIAQGVGLAGGAIAGKKATKAAMTRSPEEMRALTGAQGAADASMGAGKDVLGQSKDLLGKAGSLTTQGKQWLEQPANYYQTLLSGNRAAMQGAVAPATAQITGNYRGAAQGLSGLRGASKDAATADLNRQRVSQIAGLSTGVQSGAAGALGALGQAGLNAASPLYGAGASLAGTGGQLMGQGGGIYANLLNQGNANRQYGRQEGGQTSAAIGNLAATAGNVLSGVLGKGKGPVPATPGPNVPIRSGVPSGFPGQQPVPYWGGPASMGDAF